jgi:tRNA (guanine6-N2)-methyltransferase
MPHPVRFIAEVVPGIEDIALMEIASMRGVMDPQISGEGEVTFSLARAEPGLRQLTTVQAVYQVLEYRIPRPKALLGQQHFDRLVQAVLAITGTWAPNERNGLHISAAGADSAVFQRIANDLADATGMRADTEQKDLWIRVRRGRSPEPGWECLIRLTPRPLATRSWRVRDLPGALNATVAAAMVRLAEPRADDVFLNAGSGSATILIERARISDAAQLLGIDNDMGAIRIAQENIAAAGLVTTSLSHGDARVLPLGRGSCDTILIDLPFGQLVGSHEENRVLYPTLLREFWRVAKPGALCIMLTHEIQLMAGLLPQMHGWHVRQKRRITLRGLHPGMYVLQKSER